MDERTNRNWAIVAAIAIIWIFWVLGYSPNCGPGLKTIRDPYNRSEKT
jgi:hypothetical protein